MIVSLGPVCPRWRGLFMRRWAVAVGANSRLTRIAARAQFEPSAGNRHHASISRGPASSTPFRPAGGAFSVSLAQKDAAHAGGIVSL